MLQLRTSPSSTSKAAPLSWVEKLFARMGATFGSRFADMWRNEDLTAVKDVWAIELGKLSAEEVKAGVENLTRLSKAPNLPEFVAHCKSCRREQIEAQAPQLEDQRRAALETIDANLPKMREAVKGATACSPSAKWAYMALIRGTGKDGTALSPETRQHAVDAVLSWAGGRAIQDEADPELRAKFIQFHNECVEARK